MSDKEPWSRIREWKEKKHAKDQAREERAVLGPNAPPQPQESIDARFKMGIFREKLLFGAIVGGVTGSFFGGLDAFQGMKKEQAFGIPLKTTQAKMKFAGQIVGSSALVFSGPPRFNYLWVTMPKIIDAINRTYASGGTTVSLEFFPAKTEEGVSNLLSRIEDMNYRLQPTFVTLTWRSAFKDESLWLKIGATVQKEFGVSILLHLTCHLPRSDLVRILQNVRDAGITNILALRGDPPIGEEHWKPVPGGLRNAIELVQLIRELHGDYFCVAVAGYPEVHTECWNSPDLPPSEQSLALDLQRLKEKVDAGADFIITQFFYDVKRYQIWFDKCREIGINVPILPGYLPIQNYNSFQKFTVWCKTAVPSHIATALEKIKDDDEQVKAFGVQEAMSVCRELLAKGHRSLHFYTMNLEAAVTQVIDGLGMMPKPVHRELSWQRHRAAGSRGVSGSSKNGNRGAQAIEEVRPIFWANRQTSYVSRTNNWDEFPNGRWGDSRSPAYGELSHYYLEFKRPKVDRKALWGLPETHQDVYQVFVKFLNGQISTLPWCEQSPAPETSIISSNLRLLNANGYLTINSQPAVDGRPSTDADVGWGGPGGFVYQKAYVEFFCSPEKLKLLLAELPKFPNLSYHAMNVAGEEYTNKEGASVNAVTWGVFPGREIVQPTVVDAASFAIWKDEAFELWLTQWATAYEAGSRSHAVIKEVYDTYFLVNIVDNDFAGDEGDIFGVFKDVITRSLTAEELRGFVTDVQAENEHLQMLVHELRQVNGQLNSEVKGLREDLATSRKEQDALKTQLRQVKLQQIYELPAKFNAFLRRTAN